MNNSKKDIPKHWKWVTLDDIGIVVSGGTPSTKEPEFWNGDIPWVTPADLSNHDEVYISKGNRNISQVGLEYSSAYLLPANSVIFSSRAPIGYVAIAKDELATNQGFKNLILPTKLVSPKYVYYYLKTIKELAENMASGTTFLELSATKFRQIPFPLAPIEEQNKIVEKIEELLSELENSDSELKISLKSIESLINKTIYNAFNKIEKKKRLAEQSNITMGQSPNSSSFNADKKGVPFFQGKKEFGKTYPSVEKYTTNPIRMAKKNDILISVRAPVGDVNIANINCAIGRGLCAIEFKGYHKFLFYYLDNIKEYVKQLSTGSTFDSISKDTIENIKIPNIEIKQQYSLIDDIESKIQTYESLSKEIKYQLEKNVITVNKILQEAFCGKLILESGKINSVENNLINQIKEDNSEYLYNHYERSKRKKIVKREKKNLLNILTSSFNNNTFYFDDIIQKSGMSIDLLEEEFNSLLIDGKISKIYDKKSKSIKFKIS